MHSCYFGLTFGLKDFLPVVSPMDFYIFVPIT